VAVDITDRKKREEQLQLLMREVNHRAKNLLAVVQSLAYRTSNNGAGGEFAAMFQQRLAGLAACQELLVASEWKGVSLEDLIHAQLSPFEALEDRRLLLEGPALAINPSAAQTLGMAIHELGTNAAKYGALSNESGMVHVTWDVMDAGGPRFRLSWIEQGGPAPVQPARRGFGTTVLTEMAELGLDAEILLEFSPPGLMWQMSAPAALVLDGRAQTSFDA
jgi:two-component sensor histidine kinase